MKRLEQFSTESLDQTNGETTIDTKIEVDLISGGVGFDDEPADDDQWSKDLRNKQNAAISKRQRGADNVGN